MSTKAGQLQTSGSVLGVANNCRTFNDVLTVSGSFGAQMAAKYPDGPIGASPKVASVYAPSSYPASADHEAVTLVNGWRISSMGSRLTLTSPGRILYFDEALANLFASLNCLLTPCQPLAMGEMPNDQDPRIDCTPVPMEDPGAPAYSLALASQNPVREGLVRLRFGITRREKVELRVYDLAGRVVRTLTSREFAAGEHDLYWDLHDDQGRSVPRGVYFYQLRTPSFASQRKIAVLKR